MEVDKAQKQLASLEEAYHRAQEQEREATESKAAMEADHAFLDPSRRTEREWSRLETSALKGAEDKAEVAFEIKTWKQERVALRKQGGAMQVPASLQSKKKQLEDFKQQLESIMRAICLLNEGIDLSLGKVAEANERAFQSVAAAFATYFHSLVPSKKAQLRKVDPKGLVDDGIRFFIQNIGSDGKCGEWKDSLIELSGGQRTLLNLAFLFALARSRQCLLYIMDEIDAALDEVNQAQVATLVREVFAGCQVISVSHHQSFQIQAQCTIEIAKKEKPLLSSYVSRVINQDRMNDL